MTDEELTKELDRREERLRRTLEYERREERLKQMTKTNDLMMRIAVGFVLAVFAIMIMDDLATCEARRIVRQELRK